MALQKAYDLENTGISLPEAYHVIKRIDTFKTESEYLSNIKMSVYASKRDRDSGKDPVIENSIPLTSFLFNYDISSEDNIITQAYNFLKTTSEYEESIDV